MLDAVAQSSFKEILAGVEAELGSGAYGLWFKDCVFAGLARGTLRIGVATSFVQDWIERNHVDLLERHAREVIGAPVSVAIEIDAELARGHRAEVLRVDAAAEAEAQRGPRVASLDDFVVTPENEFPYHLVARAARGEDPEHDPLVLVGGAGSGKSHLLDAFRRPKDAPRRAPRPLFTNAREFTAHFTMAVKSRKVEEFRGYYDAFDVVVIDEMHRFAGKRATQAELVTLLKRWKTEGRRLVVASRHHPRQVDDLAPALRCLLLGGMVAQIRPYSRRSLLAIVGTTLGPDRRPVAREVVESLAEGCHGNVAELRARLLRVCGYAGLRGERPDADFVRRNFGELVSPRIGEDGRDEIIGAVCRHFDLRRADLVSKRKTRSLLLPRGLVACVLRDRLALTLKEIGALLGGRSHTSIHLLIRRYGPRIEEDAELRRLRDRLGRLASAAKGATAAAPGP